ncbi:TonB-dependent receptor (plasmid) [Sphingomonas paeninsulae]|uniref:TonB-dependent receptor n=1 Tax=Sphingomonas paeninsulae TaxID=2319844 RepID=A0A494TDL9_SPHPE|nr:TonB-dependent receptor [Sphingomonas paeninsulae]AYJ85354.1 TonB-dependent receptor [Sphingomonas paeninsulae]
MRTILLATAAVVLSPALAFAEDATPAAGATARADDGTAFGLGQIVVTATRPEGIAIGGNILGQEAIYSFDRASLDEAASLIPGVTSGNSGGSRNERLIFVRGFNRFQVPLTVDGIRVYLPADNRLDYGRFLTPDIAEIQVAKGYVSVLNGPDGMGGAVNLVTRKPTKDLEIEVRATLNLGHDAEYAGYNVFGLVGTKHDQWYAQVSYARNFQDHWDVAEGFKPTSIENGGHRDLSRIEDWRVNAKLGFTPNTTDEYSISYTRQEGTKLAPLHITDPIAAQRYWTWPAWNLDSIYFLSTTALGDFATLKTRIYRNTFYNLLSSFSTAAENTQATPKAFNSPYHDNAFGGSAELALDVSAIDRFTFAAQYRRDEHNESQQSFSATTLPNGTTEPNQRDLEDTYSLAAENRLTITPDLTFTAGVGYDWRNLIKAEEYGAPLGTNPNTTPSTLYSYPLKNSSAWSAQGQFVWQADDATSLHVSISSRARFPTIFERFSQKFGTSIPNPDLRPERATNYEIGGGRVFGPVRAEGAVFYSHIDDAIVSFPTLAYSCTGSVAAPTTGACPQVSLVQSRNLSDGNYYGVEFSLSAQISSAILVGGNYTYTHRKLNDPSNAAFRPIDVPTHKAFLYADVAPVSRLHIIPSLEIASERWTVTDVAPIVYYRTGSYMNGGLRVDLAVLDKVTVGVGVKNLFDDNYSLVDGFPEPGRSFFASLRAKY